MIHYRTSQGVRATAPLAARSEPERECARCGIIVRENESPAACDDCRLVLSYRPMGQFRNGATRPRLAFEITLHDLRTNLHGNPTKAAINQAGYPVTESAMDEDPTAHHYVTDGLGYHQWPVVTITSHGRLVASWEGWQPDLIAELAGQRGAESRAA
jgi:hypothetical protein